MHVQDKAIDIRRGGMTAKLSKYSLQQRASSLTEQQAKKGPIND